MTTTGVAKLGHYGLLHAAGDDARAFLHAQLTNDIENLPAGQARYAGWCSAKGRLLATFLVIPIADDFLLQLSLDIAPAVVKRLSMFVLRSKVKLIDATASWLQYGFWGPEAAATLTGLGFKVPGGEWSVAESEGAAVACVGVERYLLVAPSAATARVQATADAEEWILAELRAGRPLIAQPTQDQFVPQMVNLELAGGVDFRKGCYPGQEVVARAQYRGAVKRRMVRLRGAVLQPGQELFSDDAPGQPSGTVINAAGNESLAVLQVSAIDAKSPIRAQPQAAALEILPLPYAR